MKIVFYSSQEEESLMQEMPLGIGYIWAYLEQQMPEVQVRYARTWADVSREEFDILAVGALSQSIDDALGIIKKTKELYPRAIVIMGSHHITLLPEVLPEQVDVGVIGEGEITFLELVKLIKEHKFNPDELQKVEGICYRQEGVLKTTPARPFIQNLDVLPHPKREVFDYAGIIGIFTSRGCPYNCIYCSSSKFWKRKFRAHSADYVIDELNQVIEKYKPHTVHILDDLFLVNKDRFNELCEKIKQQGINKKVAFRGFVRANLVDEDTIRKMKEINFVLVRFGAETGSERLLKILKCGSVTIADAQRTIDLCHKFDISVSASFMFGVPGETKEDLQETYGFLENNRRNKFRIEGFYFLVPLPGTLIWDNAKAEGFVNNNISFRRLNPMALTRGFKKDEFIYMNEKNIPFDEFRPIVEKIGKDFGTTKIQKITSLLVKNKILRHIIKDVVKVRRKILSVFQKRS